MEFLFVFWFLIALSAFASLWLWISRSTAAFVVTIVASILTAMGFGLLTLLVLAIHGTPVTGGFVQHSWGLLAVELLFPFLLSVGTSATALNVFFHTRQKDHAA